jgi:putative ATP-binding cassette transporter
LRRTRSRKQTLPNSTPIEEGVRNLFDQLREFLIALCFPQGGRVLSFRILARVFAIATAAAQVALNAWNGPFYEAIAERNFPSFLDELLVFIVIAGGLLTLMRR